MDVWEASVCFVLDVRHMYSLFSANDSRCDNRKIL